MSTTKAIVASVAHRAWSAIAGVATLFFVAKYFSPSEQGYYYTFVSLLAVQVVFELGFAVVLVQFAAHEAAHLEEIKGVLTGSPVALARLKSLKTLAFRWYRATALFVSAVLIPVGWIFFDSNTTTSDPVDWEIAWILSVLGLSSVLSFTGILAILEGVNRIKEIAQLRLGQELLGYLLLWIGVSQGIGLFAFPMLFLGRLIVLVVWWIFSKWHHLLFSESDASLDAHSISWTKEILPFQWRIGLSWLSGYFIFSLFTPIAFHFHGAEQAGKLGITLALFSGVTTVSMVWLNVHVPRFGALFARSQHVELLTYFRVQAFQAFGVCMLGVVGAFIVLEIIETVAPTVRSRFLFGQDLWILAIMSLLNQVIFSIATLLRSEKKEPFLFSSLLSAVAIPISQMALISSWGITGMLMGYFAVTLFWGIPSAFYLLNSAKQRWLASAV